jgi:hypothetical protein
MSFGVNMAAERPKRLFNLRERLFVWQLHREMGRAKKNGARTAQLIGKLCNLLGEAIRNSDEAGVYLLADLLKLSYGENLIRPDEELKLMNLCVIAMKNHQDGIAIALLEAYTPLIRQAKRENQVKILEHFILLTYIAKKLNRDYIQDKIIACVFECAAVFEQGEENAAALCRVMKAVGIVAVKNREYAYFCRARKIVGELVKKHGDLLAREVNGLLISWAHIILKRDYMEMFVELRLLCFEVKEGCGGSLLYPFCRQSADFALLIAANRAIECGLSFLTMVMRLAEGDGRAAAGAARLAARTARLGLEMHGIDKGFRFVQPLLEEARSLLSAMERFDALKSGDNKRYLSRLLGELVMLLLVMARLKHMAANKILMKLHESWRQELTRAADRKSADKLCQRTLNLLLRRRVSERARLDTRAKQILGK